MLTKSMNPGSTIVLRLITGEEIIAKFVEEKDTHFVVDKPRSLAQTQEGVALVPVGLTADPNGTGLPFYKSTVITHWQPKKEVSDSYIQATSSLQFATGTGFDPSKLGK